MSKGTRPPRDRPDQYSICLSRVFFARTDQLVAECARCLRFPSPEQWDLQPKKPQSKTWRQGLCPSTSRASVWADLNGAVKLEVNSGRICFWKTQIGKKAALLRDGTPLSWPTRGGLRRQNEDFGIIFIK
ncbi:unnamed protein product [Protopolystoma xenopodis]|uniref:Uncharacterized protein n=1 Tax=Protopolystoma xenopodis TaxID=117903 RepID=A0A448X121_9PLAT|nr:unnamed protein product [Protopolystoma xenopodis]